jgi:glycosyltransferase involved in cell wall biosynthesis
VKLGIISDASHTWDAHGRLCVLSPVARQFEQWAQLFEEVTVCAPLVRGLPSPTSSPYRATNIRLLPVRGGGGDTVGAKLALALKIPSWWSAIRELLSRVDAVHIRCPNNISILGLLALERSDVLRQAVFTGTWNGYATEPRTYRWQREYLRSRFRGPVAVYGDWPDQPANICPSFSPSYRDEDWIAETSAVARKLERLKAPLSGPIRLITVGSLDPNKNQQVAVRAVSKLRALNVDAQLDILGDGPERARLTDLVTELHLRDHVTLHGATPPAEMRHHYRAADFVIQPVRSEGFGKVPLEGFFHGVIPIMSDVTLHPQFAGTASDTRGRCFPTEDPVAAATHVAELVARPDEMRRMITNGRKYVRRFTLDAWREHLREMLTSQWGVSLP